MFEVSVRATAGIHNSFAFST